jgi:hypothetical protein
VRPRIELFLALVCFVVPAAMAQTNAFVPETRSVARTLGGGTFGLVAATFGTAL